MQTFKEYITEAVKIDDSAFVRSHGNKPKGKGMWIFSVKQKPTPKELSDPKVVFDSSSMDFKEAKKAAAKHFGNSADRIFVLP